MTTSFYVYQLRAETEECPFYIGKGQGNRKYQHYQYARKGKKSLKDSKIRKYERDKIKVLSEVIFESENEDECFALEIELIKAYGRRDKGVGFLTNQTDGGEGRSGAIVSDLHKQKISAIMSGRVRSAEHCKSISRVKMGHQISEEARAKISESLKGRNLSPEHIEKLRLTHIGKVHSEETKSKISSAHIGKTISQEQRCQISKTLKGKKRNETSVDKGSKYSRQAAIDHIKAQRCSSLSQKQYCLQHCIKEQTFCGWKRSPYVKQALENT
jgi:NUMOD3 motif